MKTIKCKKCEQLEAVVERLKAEQESDKEPARALYEEAKRLRTRCQRLEAALREIAEICEFDTVGLRYGYCLIAEIIDRAALKKEEK